MKKHLTGQAEVKLTGKESSLHKQCNREQRKLLIERLSNAEGAEMFREQHRMGYINQFRQHTPQAAVNQSNRMYN